MDIKKEKVFVISLNENEMSYDVLVIDWDDSIMGIISRFRSNDRNKIICKAWFDNSELERKSSVYSWESDEEYFERLEILKKAPLYEDHREELIKYLG